VFVAENNGWSFSSRTEWLFPEARMSRVWRGFDIPVHEMDGNDPEAVTARMDDAVARARAGEGPSVLEGLTYRMDPHIYWDREDYRTPDEAAAWADRDPIARTAARLLALGVDDERLTAVEESVGDELDDAFAAVGDAAAPAWTGTEAGMVR